MNRQLMIQIYNTLNQIEVKGQQNLSCLLGVINILQKELNEPCEEGDLNANTKE